MEEAQTARSGREVQITVRGRLSERLAAAFEGMTPLSRGDRTELVGTIADQAQLHGLLTRIRDLGLELERVDLTEGPPRRPVRSRSEK